MEALRSQQMTVQAVQDRFPASARISALQAAVTSRR